MTEEFRGAGPEALAPYDLVILNYYEKKKPELRWGERADNALVNFVRSGKGLVVYHFSMAAFEGWDEFEKMSGANWRPNNGHHSARHDYTVTIRDPDCPITKGMKATFAEPNDELYANLKWQPAGTFHVLATAWDDHKLYTNKKDTQPIPGDGHDEPMLWTVQYGSGRVFVTALGHDPAAMNSAASSRRCSEAANGPLREGHHTAPRGTREEIAGRGADTLPDTLPAAPRLTSRDPADPAGKVPALRRLALHC